MNKNWLSYFVVGGLLAMASTFVLGADGDEAAAAELLAKQINAERLLSLSGSNKFAAVVMPTSVGNPNYSGNFTHMGNATLTFWRESINGKAHLFVKVTPTTASFFFCPGGSSFSIIQNGRDYGDAFSVTRGAIGAIGSSVCESLKASEIFMVDQWPTTISTNFDEASAFVVSYPDSSSGTGSVSVAAVGAAGVTCVAPQVLQGGACVSPTPTTTLSGSTYSNGTLIIKGLAVDTGFGQTYFDVIMSLKALSNPLTFTVDSATPSK